MEGNTAYKMPLMYWELQSKISTCGRQQNTGERKAYTSNEVSNRYVNKK
jgi:hypothetical protein